MSKRSECSGNTYVYTGGVIQYPYVAGDVLDLSQFALFPEGATLADLDRNGDGLITKEDTGGAATIAYVGGSLVLRFTPSNIIYLLSTSQISSSCVVVPSIPEPSPEIEPAPEPTPEVPPSDGPTPVEPPMPAPIPIEPPVNGTEPELPPTPMPEPVEPPSNGTQPPSSPPEPTPVPEPEPELPPSPEPVEPPMPEPSEPPVNGTEPVDPPSSPPELPPVPEPVEPPIEPPVNGPEPMAPAPEPVSPPVPVPVEPPVSPPVPEPIEPPVNGSIPVPVPVAPPSSGPMPEIPQQEPPIAPTPVLTPVEPPVSSPIPNPPQLTPAPAPDTTTIHDDTPIPNAARSLKPHPVFGVLEGMVATLGWMKRGVFDVFKTPELLADQPQQPIASKATVTLLSPETSQQGIHSLATLFAGEMQQSGMVSDSQEVERIFAEGEFTYDPQTQQVQFSEATQSALTKHLLSYNASAFASDFIMQNVKQFAQGFCGAYCKDVTAKIATIGIEGASLLLRYGLYGTQSVLVSGAHVLTDVIEHYNPGIGKGLKQTVETLALSYMPLPALLASAASQCVNAKAWGAWSAKVLEETVSEKGR